MNIDWGYYNSRITMGVTIVELQLELQNYSRITIVEHNNYIIQANIIQNGVQ